jgi:hypothetical protein
MSNSPVTKWWEAIEIEQTIEPEESNMKIGCGRNVAVTAQVCAVLIVSALTLLADDPPQYSPWSTPTNLGPVVNSPYDDGGVCVTRDGLTLVFQSSRPGGFGRTDFYVTHRANADEPWSTPINLGPNINTDANENACAFSADEHSLYFQSHRPDGLGGSDIYVSRRHNKRDDFAWQPAKNLGSPVNSPGNDFYVGYYEDDATGIVTLYFSQGTVDIYASTLQPDETWSTPVLVPELSSPYWEGQPAVSRSGLELFFFSNRPGTYGQFDLWFSTRASTSDPWSTPMNLGPIVNTAGANQGHPAISGDGTILYFYSDRAGGSGLLDLWVTTRHKLKGHEMVSEVAPG